LSRQKRFVRELLRYIIRNNSLWQPKDYGDKGITKDILVSTV